MFLVVGLGNPEIKYVFTRHNTGFLAIDSLLDRLGGLKLNDDKFKGVYTKTKIDNIDTIIAKPMTYMNLSGEFIRPLADYYKIDYQNIIVVYDEMALPVGRVKITKEGSAAGHNGIKSIIQHLGTEKFVKVRIGINDPNINIPQIDYVLSKYTPEEFKIQKENIERAVDAILNILKLGVDDTMNKYNNKNI